MQFKIEIDPSELAAAKINPYSLGAQHTEFTKTILKNFKYHNYF